MCSSFPLISLLFPLYFRLFPRFPHRDYDAVRKQPTSPRCTGTPAPGAAAGLPSRRAPPRLLPPHSVTSSTLAATALALHRAGETLTGGEPSSSSSWLSRLLSSAAAGDAWAAVAVGGLVALGLEGLPVRGGEEARRLLCCSRCRSACAQPMARKPALDRDPSE